MELPTPPVKNAPYPYSGSFTSAGSRKKRKNKLRLEAPSISTLFQRATDDLGVASTWLTECQRPFCCVSLVVNLITLFGSVQECSVDP